MLLHRPFIERAGTGNSKAQSSYSSFRIGSSAAARGIRIAAHMEPRDILMFPYAFSLYPVLQCCLIHMYNTKNPDARIAGPAKVDLATGLSLINRLKKMSHNASKLHALLETIMENNSIFLNQSYGMDDTKWTSTSAPSFMNTDSGMTTSGAINAGIAKGSPSRSSPLSQPATTPPPPSSQNIMASRLFQQSFEMSSLADIPGRWRPFPVIK